MFQTAEGYRMKVRDYDGDFVHWMSVLRTESPTLFSAGVDVTLFSLRRSIRRGAILETFNRVDGSVVNLMNRWRTKEHARGTQPGLSMQQTYTQVCSLFSELKLYSKAL